MSITNKRVFGLDVNVSLSDVENRTQSLSNLGLDVRDLDLVRGIAEAGVDSDDLQCVSNLSRPIYKTFDRYISDTGIYNVILSRSGGVDAQIQGNLDIAGGLSGSSIKFQQLSGDLTLNAQTTLKWGDISTSRVSSWSSLPVSSVPSITDPILYGASVKIGGSFSVGKLKTRTTAIPKIFDSEVPTHKIKFNINGQTRYVYAMKGIPLTFRGFFRNFDATVGLTGVSGNNRVSWRIVPLDGSTTESFSNVGTSTTSTLNYRSPFSKERFIEVYFNPNNISSLNFPRTNISELPNIRLNNLLSINISSNQFREIPDLKFLGPNLQTVEISFNNFFQSSNANERTFNHVVLSKIPDSTVTLNVRSCFFGSIHTVQNPSGSLPRADLSSLTSLQTLQITRDANPYFYPDSNDPGNLPLVASGVRRYFAARNDFRLIPTDDPGNNKHNIQTLPNLIDLSINGNFNLSSTTFSINSSAIETINISTTNLNVPNLQNRQNLRSFEASFLRGNAGTLFVGNISKFSGCPSLQRLGLYEANITGQIPKFATNRNLSSIDMRFCNGLVAGRPDKADTKLLYNDTFADCKSLVEFYLAVNNVNFAGEIEAETFTPVAPTLQNLMILTNNRSQGSFPNLNSCTRLVRLWSYSNGWSGNLPSLANSPNINYIDLSYNKFGEGTDGVIPYANKSNLQFIFVNNNQLKAFSSAFGGLPGLRFLYASSNLITGTIPRFDLACPNVERLLLNNNSFDGYLRGLDTLLKLTIFDVSNNGMSRSLVDAMLFDLVKNYNSARRRGVVINLLGNQSPTPYPIVEGLINGITNVNVIKNSDETLNNAVYSNVSATGSANGTGALFNVSISNEIVNISIAAQGKNYVVGETLTISNITVSKFVGEEQLNFNTGSITFNFTTTTATDTTQFVGRAAADYLRSQGWVVQTA
jgi:Leucine-rich repeat (LRR) protein